jgi:SAM-dependent methyltransferase
LSDNDTAYVARRHVSDSQTTRANRSWWDGAADEYQQEHGAFLGDSRFVWCPEGLDEAEAGLLGDVRGKRVLEVGCGAAQCSRWLLAQGAEPVGFDLSAGQLGHALRLDAAEGVTLPLVQADAQHLPFADATFDLACSAYGAVPFVADSAAVMREVARVLRPGGRWVFAVTHPIRWSLPDDPGEGGLVVVNSYFDRRPYIELDDHGMVSYAEHHRTLGDRVHEITEAPLHLTALIEPEWPKTLTTTWGAWSPHRGRLIPGTAIFICEKA